MAGLQRIFHEAVVIVFVAQHADAALSQIGIAVFCLVFRNHQHLLVRWQVKRRKEPAGASSYDQHIRLYYLHTYSLFIKSPYSANSSMRSSERSAFSRTSSDTVTSPVPSRRHCSTFARVTFFMSSQTRPSMTE